MIFIASPKKWQLPKKNEVLIYDACGEEALAPYLTKYSVTTMNLRGEEMNLPCLLRAMLKLEFWKDSLLNAYSKAYIQAVSPKVVITRIDNNVRFYEVSKSFSSTKTIMLQNGIRDKWLDAHAGEYKYHVDYMLVFGSSIGKYYSAHISGEVLPVGSLKNNAVSNSNGVAGDGVLFISEYRAAPKNNEPIDFNEQGEPVYHDQYYSDEVIILKFLSKWCTKNKKHLKIAAVSPEKIGPEFDFFSIILKGCAWEYMPRTGQYSSYKLADSAEIVVTITSTLSEELIARGKKTAVLNSRFSSILKVVNKFGWSADLPNNGPFWTNDQDETQFQRVMDYLNSVSDEDWEQTRQHYTTELMEFDPGNKRFVALLDQLLPRAESQTYAN